MFFAWLNDQSSDLKTLRKYQQKVHNFSHFHCLLKYQLLRENREKQKIWCIWGTKTGLKNVSSEQLMITVVISYNLTVNQLV